LIALKADPRVFGAMLSGVRSAAQSREELEDDIDYWKACGHGTWAVASREHAEFLGITGLAARPDGRGVALRFAFHVEAQGHGYAREAAAAALEFGFRVAGLPRIIAVVQNTNTASKAVLASIGMRQHGRFLRCGRCKLVYEAHDDGVTRQLLSFLSAR
jgi:RimJ/RimL family protein N-acetyltransferase